MKYRVVRKRDDYGWGRECKFFIQYRLFFIWWFVSGMWGCRVAYDTYKEAENRILTWRLNTRKCKVVKEV